MAIFNEDGHFFLPAESALGIEFRP